MSETREFLKHRRQILERRIAVLMAELEEVKLAERALEERNRGASERQLPLMSPNNDVLVRTSQSDDKTLTIKEKIVRVMFRAQRPLSSRSILKLIHQEYGEDLPRTSFSPQISRLKQEGRVKVNKELKKYELTNQEINALQLKLK